MRVISGTAGSLILKTPKGDSTRPTTDKIKETLFNIISNELYDATFLDLFAGSGGIGIEALSRGAKEAYFCDIDREAIECIRQNLIHTKLIDRATILKGSYEANLEKLAGISAVKEILSEVRTRKDEIKAQKTAEFNQVEMKKLLDFKTSAINFINEDIERIKNTDLDKLQSDIAKMKANKSRAIMAVNDAWEDMVIDSGLHIKEVIYNKIEKHFKDLIGEINSAQRTRSKTRSYEVEVKDNGWSNLFGLFGDRYKTETRHKTITIQTVNASEIYSALSDVTDDAQELISGSFEKELKDFKKQAYSVIVGSARKAVDDDNILDPVLITHIVKGIMNSIEIPEPKFEGVPSSLRQSGDLDEDEGRKYMDDAKDYARNLEQSLKSKTSDAIKTLSSTLRSREVGSEMFAQYTKNIEQLQSDLCNKEETIAHKEMILEELESAE